MALGRKALALAPLAAALALAAPGSAAAANIGVTTTADQIGGAGCSLREAITAAESNDAGPGGDCTAGDVLGTDTIAVPAGHYTLTGAAGDNNNFSGDLDIDSNVLIAGAGQTTTIVDGGQHDRVFDIDGGPTVELRDLKVTQGRTPDASDQPTAADATVAGTNSEGAVGPDAQQGGGIQNHGSLTLTRVTVSDNLAGTGGDGGDGGNVTYTANAGVAGGNSNGGNGGFGGNGGGIANLSPGTLVVSHSTIGENSAGAGGNGGNAGTAGQGGSGTTGATGGQTNFGLQGFNGAGGSGGSGGGIYNDSGSAQAVTIDNSLVATNTTGAGGDGGNGGTGGTGGAGSSIQGVGGNAFGGSGGFGGDGGAIAIVDGTLKISASTISDNQSHNGGNGGFGGQGGDHGSGTTLNSHGGAYGGAGGFGGSFGGVSGFAGTEDIDTSTIARNTSGDGGAGGSGGTAGAGNPNLAPDTAGGDGGPAGRGGGAQFEGGSGGSLTNSTVASNSSGNGGDGGDGGAGPLTSLGGGGGNSASGAGVTIAGQQVFVQHATVASNTNGTFGSGGGGGTATTPTPGNAGTAVADVGGVKGDNGGNVALENSIVANNSGNQCGGTFVLAFSVHNLEFPNSESCQNNEVTSDPLLGPLQDNGGPSQTMLLGAGSPAIDAAGTGSPCAPTDQRGVTRPKGTGCDMGAVEISPPGATTGDAGPVAQTTAKLNGTVNTGEVPTTYRFQYGKTTAYGSQTPLASAGHAAAPFAAGAAIAGLEPDTAYHFRLIATSPDGSATGTDKTFKTPPIPPFAGVTIVTKSAKVSKKKKVPIKLSCPPAAVTPCKGTLTLTVKVKKKGKKKGKTVKLGSATFTIAAGKSATISVKLSKKGLKAFGKKKKLTATASAPATDARGGTPVKATGKVTIKPAKKKKKKG